MGFPHSSVGKKIRLQHRRPQFDSWVGRIPWRRERLSTPVFWPGEFHGLSLWGCKELDKTEQISLHFTSQHSSPWCFQSHFCSDTLIVCINIYTPPMTYSPISSCQRPLVPRLMMPSGQWWIIGSHFFLLNFCEVDSLIHSLFASSHMQVSWGQGSYLKHIENLHFIWSQSWAYILILSLTSCTNLYYLILWSFSFVISKIRIIKLISADRWESWCQLCNYERKNRFVCVCVFFLLVRWLTGRLVSAHFRLGVWGVDS